MSDPLPTILKVFSTTATCISAPWFLVNIDINITNDDWICKCDNKAQLKPNIIASGMLLGFRHQVVSVFQQAISFFASLLLRDKYVCRR
ncbi:hypothetical protein H9Y13_09555 [Aeromonas veronii]|uniref:hypothetical protein n=1 Tax=Aeromonas sp. PI_26 TaxID=2899138 RepID=UPI0022EA6197|nr:hypothetical protein [Aeromonas sp. PI_26]KAJ8740586.1 hypothetical protein H9Y13_09555 [Aeromonas veronii]MDA3315977.1 hypothetical protein [Aeromonas sp. PI_26]